MGWAKGRAGLGGGEGRGGMLGQRPGLRYEEKLGRGKWRREEEMLDFAAGLGWRENKAKAQVGWKERGVAPRPRRLAGPI